MSVWKTHAQEYSALFWAGSPQLIEFAEVSPLFPPPTKLLSGASDRSSSVRGELVLLNWMSFFRRIHRGLDNFSGFFQHPPGQFIEEP